MRVGIAGPSLPRLFSRHLSSGKDAPLNLPEGMGGVPVNLLVGELLKMGFDLVLFTLDPLIKEPVSLKGTRFELHAGPLRPRARARMADLFGEERSFLHDRIRDSRLDIVHAHWTYEYALAAISSDVPTLVTVHDWAPRILRLRRDAYRLVRYAMDWMTMRSGVPMVAVSPYLKNRIGKRWRRNVPVLPNGIEDEYFLHIGRERTEQGMVILSAANGFSRLKNQASLLRAFRDVQTLNPKAELLLVGDGSEPGGPAQRWAAENRFDRSIRFIGPVGRETLRKLMDGADILVQPSLEESFGMVFIEAMSRRLPVLGGKFSGAVPWLLDQGSAGLLCDVTSPEDLAKNILEILNSTEAWNRLSEAGFRRAWENFRISKIARDYLDQYQTVLKECVR